MIFNSKFPTIMHIDLNSCFASIEQQANPFLRGKPIVVAAYVTDMGCVLAPSIEAKKLGIKVGMRVKDARLIDPHVVVLASDPSKYRFVHLKLKKIISEYTDNFVPKSIDEFTLNLEGYPVLANMSIGEVGVQIKKRIKEEIGDWLTVSIGVAPNRFLAKLAAGLHKPDGLDVIDCKNYLQIFSRLALTDLPGIKMRNVIRLNKVGIFDLMQMVAASSSCLRAAFNSVCGYYWFLRLHGFECDDFVSRRGSFGNSFVLPQKIAKVEPLLPILAKLTQKTGMRLRAAGYKAAGVHLAIVFRDGDFWHKGFALRQLISDSGDIYKNVVKLISLAGINKPVRELAISVYNLSKNKVCQLNIFEDQLKKEKLTTHLDTINNRWGSFTVVPARMFLLDRTWVPDRIAFGGIKELEEQIIA